VRKERDCRRQRYPSFSKRLEATPPANCHQVITEPMACHGKGFCCPYNVSIHCARRLLASSFIRIGRLRRLLPIIGHEIELPATFIGQALKHAYLIRKLCRQENALIQASMESYAIRCICLSSGDRAPSPRLKSGISVQAV